MEAYLDMDKRSETNKGQQQLKRATVTAVWLTMVPNLLNSTTLSMEEFMDNLRLHFGLQPHGLRQTCIRCGVNINVDRALQ